MTLSTAGDYIAEARRILQDTQSVKRYPDADLVEALNIGLTEMRRIRPDLFLGRFNAVPRVAFMEDAVDVDAQYRSALLYYITGRVELRDSEDTKDARAGVLMNKFVAQLLTVQA